MALNANHTSDLENDGTFKLKKNKNNPIIDFNNPNLVHNNKIGKFLAGTIKKMLDGTFSSNFAYLNAKEKCKTKNSTY